MRSKLLKIKKVNTKLSLRKAHSSKWNESLIHQINDLNSIVLNFRNGKKSLDFVTWKTNTNLQAWL